MKRRYLTKSRYKLAAECPTKLYYMERPAEYRNRKIEDQFLKALANGGFQVGALARCYYPEGILVEERDTDAAARKTDSLLSANENIVLFEPAFVYDDLAVRVDILKKVGDHVSLIEVKAKSFHSSEAPGEWMLKKRKGVQADWIEYFRDIAFQHFVVSRARQDWTVIPYLMLVDKDRVATVDGLNQKFLIARASGERQEIVSARGLRPEDLGDEILSKCEVSNEVTLVQAAEEENGGYETRLREWAAYYVEDRKAQPVISSACKKCEFRVSPDKLGNAKNGMNECWSEALGRPIAADERTVLDLWNLRLKDHIDAGRYFLSDLREEHFAESKKSKKDVDEPGLTPKQRQWLAVRKIREKDDSPWIDRDSLDRVMKGWRFPLHFIDFETTMVAVPFYRGARPYQQVAFQFSHHVVEADGSIRHAGEWINTERGKFPSFDFVRALKSELDSDEGTVFRYAPHENTVLVQLREQLLASEEADKRELSRWIETLTTPTKARTGEWKPGPRVMIDLNEIVKRFVLLPETIAYTSIKQTLPAVLRASPTLRKKYSAPIYGTDALPSRNFRKHAWIQMSGDTVRDPYDLLPPVFDGISETELEEFLTETEKIQEGGSAMYAYAQMQFSEMPDAERERLVAALLKYCELDTFAMVLVWEFLREGARGA